VARTRRAMTVGVQLELLGLKRNGNSDLSVSRGRPKFIFHSRQPIRLPNSPARSWMNCPGRTRPDLAAAPRRPKASARRAKFSSAFPGRNTLHIPRTIARYSVLPAIVKAEPYRPKRSDREIFSSTDSEGLIAVGAFVLQSCRGAIRWRRFEVRIEQHVRRTPLDAASSAALSDL